MNSNIKTNFTGPRRDYEAWALKNRPDPATPIGTFTIYTWGPGSAIATLALVRERYADLL